MREYKFRVWDGRIKNFVVEYDGGFSGAYPIKITLNGKPEWDADYGSGSPDYWYIQQYTGVKDRNGKEIYEGDIVKWGMSHDQENSFKRLRFVEFCDKQLLYKVVEVGDLPASVDYLYEAIQPSTRWCEVVGNIFENPELLIYERV